MIYLASPLSHPDPKVMLARVDAAARCAGHLLKRGVLVFSPIAHTYKIKEQLDLPHEWSWWEQIDRQYIALCKALYVLDIDGARESVGVRAEIKYAWQLRMPIVRVNEEGEDLGDMPIW